MISASILIYAGAFLSVLTVVVFFHELGHFSMARLCGVRVETFAIGFGREIFGWNDSRGTRWKVCLLPLGGYVKFWGDDSAASTPDEELLDRMTPAQRAVSFHHKNLAQKFAVVAAGPVANFILGIVILTVLFSAFGRVVSSSRVDIVQPGSAAEQAGFLPGDVVRTINGRQIGDFADLQRNVMLATGESLEIEIERAGRPLTLVAVPRSEEFTDQFGNVQRRGLLGVVHTNAPADQVLQRENPLTALSLAVKETYFIVEQTFVYIGRVFAGKEGADQMGGPLRIAQISGQMAQVSLAALIHLTAVLSVSIGLINLLPVPMLDGGHLFFYAVEAVIRRPVNARVLDFSYRIGFALVITLMIFVTWNDLVNLQVVDFLTGLFS